MPPKDPTIKKDPDIITTGDGVIMRGKDGSYYILDADGTEHDIPADPQEAGKYTQEPEEDDD